MTDREALSEALVEAISNQGWTTWVGEGTRDAILDTVIAWSESRLTAEHKAREQAEAERDDAEQARSEAFKEVDDAADDRLSDQKMRKQAEADRDRYKARADEVIEALAAQGLPENATIEGLIRHHCANAELKGVFDGERAANADVLRYKEARRALNPDGEPGG